MSQLLKYIPETEKEYYRKYLSQYQPGRYFAKFNWPAFMFPPLWMFYRRMYGLGIGFIFGQLAIYVLIGEFGNKYYIGHVGLGAFLVLYLLAGFYGTAMYAKFLDKRMKKGKPYPSPSWWKTVLSVILFYILVILLAVIIVLII